MPEISNKIEEITEKYQAFVKKSLERDKEIEPFRHEKLIMEKQKESNEKLKLEKNNINSWLKRLNIRVMSEIL